MTDQALRTDRRPRLVLWISLGVAVALAVLVTVLATSGSSGQQSARSPLIGKPAPAIKGPSILGGPAVQLSAYTGKWVLVNFAASWCVPCRQETPQLLAFSQDHQQARRRHHSHGRLRRGRRVQSGRLPARQPQHLAGRQRWPGGGRLRDRRDPRVLSGGPIGNGGGQVRRSRWWRPS